MFDKFKQSLLSGDVVAIPTETVYGLAACITSPEGIKKIFSTKERPFFDPLIVHISSVEMAKTVCSEWSPIAQALAQHYWPGPLSLVLPKADTVNPMITSGLKTVGLRMPNHPLTLQLIHELNTPLAAPSANKFGKTSPTTSEHVRSEFGDTLLVLEGGSCDVGIESTILEIQNSNLIIHRKGQILKSDIESFLKSKNIYFQFLENQEKDKIQTPGQVRHHYMPKIPLVLVKDIKSIPDLISYIETQLQQLPNEIEGVRLIKPLSKIKNPQELRLPHNAHEASRVLYSELRSLAESGADLMYFRLNNLHGDESWGPIMDRLNRAASLIL
ncbi:MAG TPA: L-threonylcarbamoyladenylate synthase [Pseudobdellovibrionaceae bacterium]|nr:L-threonylcarbamoyladenylate synthase [Pseudobdellovibrionaceae bacterium]